MACCLASVAAKTEADCMSPASMARVSSMQATSKDGTYAREHAQAHTGENTGKVGAGDVAIPLNRANNDSMSDRINELVTSHLYKKIRLYFILRGRFSVYTPVCCKAKVF